MVKKGYDFQERFKKGIEPNINIYRGMEISDGIK